MKPLKKIATLLLAAALAVGVCIPAFATGENTTTNPGTITVDNPKEGVTYTAYKIFDVVYDTKTVDGKTVAGDHYSYTIKNSSEWFSTVQTYANTTDSGLTLTPSASDSTVYVVETTDAFSASAFAAELKSALNTMTPKLAGTELTRTGNTDPASASNLPLGYYFVTSSTGALANLTTTEPDVTIHDKNDIPFNKTETVDNVTYDDDITTSSDGITKGAASVQVGDTVNYTITGKVPDTTGFTAYTYLVADTMSNGLTFKKDVKVTIDGADVTTACTITYDVESNANKFTISIPVMNYQEKVTKPIVVTYSAVVNENAIATIQNNSAVLEYSNDPTSNTTATTQPDKETVYSAKILINKYKSGDTNTKLAGAEFKLYRYALKNQDNTYSFETSSDEASETIPVTESTEGAVKVFYKYMEAADTKPAMVTWVEEKAATETEVAVEGDVKITDTSGEASFDGLADGTYYLLETEAPAGYNLLDNPVVVTVNVSNATDPSVDSLTVAASVANETGTKLPSTGGIGRTIFLVAGLVLIVGAGVALVVRHRASKR